MFSFEIHSDDSIFVRHKMDCMMTYIRKSWKSIVKSEDESREIILDSQRLAKSPQDPYEARMIHIHCRYVKWWFVWFSGSGDISGLLTGHTCTPHVHHHESSRWNGCMRTPNISASWNSTLPEIARLMTVSPVWPHCLLFGQAVHS